MAAIYQQQWQLEWLFKAIKHNLKITTVLGTSKKRCHDPNPGEP